VIDADYDAWLGRMAAQAWDPPRHEPGDNECVCEDCEEEREGMGQAAEEEVIEGPKNKARGERSYRVLIGRRFPGDPRGVVRYIESGVVAQTRQMAAFKAGQWCGDLKDCELARIHVLEQGKEAAET